MDVGIWKYSFEAWIISTINHKKIISKYGKKLKRRILEYIQNGQETMGRPLDFNGLVSKSFREKSVQDNFLFNRKSRTG